MSSRPDLRLRPWTERDAPALRQAIDEDVDHLRPWLGWTLEEPASLERTRERLRGWAAQYETGRGYRWAITPRDRPDRILGGANLNNRVGPAAHDVGYWVRKSAAGQGIAGAAVAAVVVHAFDDRAVDRLVSRCDVANEASAAFARALGFRLIGRSETTFPDGAPRPILELGMTRHEFRRLHAEALRERGRRVQLDTGSEV